MAQISGNDGVGDHSHVIDIDVADHSHAISVYAGDNTAAGDANTSPAHGAERRSCTHDDESCRCFCAVCMELKKWVAVGPCGHREVCGECTVRNRFFRCDNRCSICRTPCPTVLVAKAQNGDGDSGRRGAFSRPPACEGRVGEHWYHSGAAAYFDDEQQYKEAQAACSKLPPPHRHVSDEGLAPPRWPVLPPPRRGANEDGVLDHQSSRAKMLAYALYVATAVLSFAVITWNSFH